MFHRWNILIRFPRITKNHLFYTFKWYEKREAYTGFLFNKQTWKPTKLNIQIENIGSGKRPHNAIKGFVELPCWSGYFLVEEPNYLIKTKVVTDGRIDLCVDGQIKQDNNIYIEQEQVNSYFYLLKHQERIKHSILSELKKEFPRLLSDDYASWDHDEGGFPKITELTPGFDFKNYIGPASISIGEDVKEEVAYINRHFQCRWDPEHGFEVITHKDRVIDISLDADIF